MIYRAPYPWMTFPTCPGARRSSFIMNTVLRIPIPACTYYALTSLDRCKLESVPAEMDFPFVDPQRPAYAEGSAEKDPVFSWSPYAGSSQYTLQISGSDDLSEPLYEYTLSDTGRIVNLNYQTQYFWRVRSDNSEQWSPLWTFTTELPPVVEILFPPDYYEGIDPEVSRFTWEPLEDAVFYELKLASDPEMQDIILHEENIADTSLDIGGLEHGTYYYWQLRSGKYDRWTDVRKLKTREAHIATLWQRSMMTQSMPYYMDTELQAGGLALGDHDGNTLLYVLHSDSGDASVSVFDAESGEALYMTLDLSGVSGGTYALRDIAVAEDGRIYAVNCADKGESFKLYRWAGPAGPAECVYIAENVAYRLGDHITLSGSETTGDLTLYAPAARSDKLLKLRWQSVSHSFDAQQITLGRGNSSNPDLALLPDDEGFYINSTEYYLRYFSSDGTFLDWMKGNTSLSPSANAIAGFSRNGKNYIAAYNSGTESAQIIDLTDGIRTALFAGSTCRLGIEENAECRGDVEVDDNGDGTFTLYVMGERNGIGAYVFDAASAMTGTVETAAISGIFLDENDPEPFQPGHPHPVFSG
ncbi:MAG: hypothetical protein U5N26_10730 [Candidatus Marinimicrobia bacterium]|nr:hypothetical protein [Candidatus Neomarinimicrobiota bacterium]